MSEETVEISVDAAVVALRELDILISETDPVEEHGDSLSPLARTKKRIEAMKEFAVDGEMEDGLDAALEIIEGVAEDTGAETSRVDPLQDDVFRARDELNEVFE